MTPRHQDAVADADADAAGDDERNGTELNSTEDHLQMRQRIIAIAVVVLFNKMEFSL